MEKVNKSKDRLAHGSSTDVSSGSKQRDLWTMIKDMKDKDKKQGSGNNEDGMETVVMVVGNKQCGKTSLINRLRNKDDLPAPTVALEYRFARSTRGTAKDIAHIWELADGTNLSELLEIPIQESNIHLTTFVIVVDLSKPADAAQALMHFLERVSNKVNNTLDGLEQRGSKRPKGLRTFALKKYGNDHPDFNNGSTMNVIPIPVVIVGTKYDLFRDMEPERKKLVCKFLRYVAHARGASLLFVDLRDENMSARARKLLNHHAFRSSPLQEVCFDHNKPICVPAGQDSLGQIGAPPSDSSRDTIGRQNTATLATWKRDFDHYFPPSMAGNYVANEVHFIDKIKVKLEDIDFKKYPEPTLDTLRAQKDEELRRMREFGENKSSKETLSAALNVGGTKGASGKAYSRAKANLRE